MHSSQKMSLYGLLLPVDDVSFAKKNKHFLIQALIMQYAIYCSAPGTPAAMMAAPTATDGGILLQGDSTTAEPPKASGFSCFCSCHAGIMTNKQQILKASWDWARKAGMACDG